RAVIVSQLRSMRVSPRGIAGRRATAGTGAGRRMMQIRQGETRMLRSCDTMTALAAVTAHGQTLFAKNSDRPANECQPLVQHERRSHPSGAMVPCQFVPI